MFNYTDEDGNFIVESGSAVPILKISGSTLYVSGSILPFEASSNAFSEIGSLDKPFKELYVESSSINFVDTSKARDHEKRRVKFSKQDVDNLRSGKPIHPDGHLSASGDLYVSGSTSLIGRTDILGETRIDGLTDVRGGFRINGTAITDAELQALRGLSTGDGSIQTQLDAKHATINAGNRLNANLIGGGDVSSIEFNQLNGIGSSTIATQLAAKQDTITFGKSSGNALKSEEALTTNDVLLMGSSHVKGRTYSQLKDDLSLVKGDVGLGNVDNTTDANKPVSTATQTALNAKATTAGVAGDLLPDADGTRDLGSSTKEWQDLFIDGTANIDNASVGTGTFDNVTVSRVSSIRGIHVLGGPGVVTISQIPANGLIDARSANVFYLGVDGTFNGMRGLGVMGQIVTFISPNSRRNDFTNLSTNVNIHASEKFQFPANRTLSLRGPQAARFIYDESARKWYRLI